jgi:hypothetical protein
MDLAEILSKINNKNKHKYKIYFYNLYRVYVMRAKPRGHMGPCDRAGRAGRCLMAFVMLGIICALASALDLAGLGTP